jgi:predicted transcriptional regulator
MSVKNYYIKKPTTINQDQTIKDALSLFSTKHFNSAIVVDDNEKIVGTISIYDISRDIIPPAILDNPSLGASLYRKGFFEELCKDVGDKKIKSLMRKDFAVVSPEAHILEVLALFIAKDLYFVPVMEDKKIVGILTRSNLKRAIALAMELPV